MARGNWKWIGIALFALCVYLIVFVVLNFLSIEISHSQFEETSRTMNSDVHVLVNQLACRIEWIVEIGQKFQNSQQMKMLDEIITHRTYTDVVSLPNGNLVILKKVRGSEAACVKCCFQEYILLPSSYVNFRKQKSKMKPLMQFCQTFSLIGEIKSQRTIIVQTWCQDECKKSKDQRPTVELHPIIQTTAAMTRVNQKVTFWRSQENNEKSLKVMILALDELSRHEMVSSLPLTFDLLKAKYMDLKGFSQISSDWVTNYVTMLTGLESETWDAVCGFSETKSFNDCPFVWKDFRRANYITSYADYLRILHNKRNFFIDSTDYQIPEFNQLLPNSSDSSRASLEILFKFTLQFSRSFESVATFSVTRIPTTLELLTDLDFLLHRFLLTLENQKFKQNTLVILYSNSGRGLFEHQIQPILFIQSPKKSFLHRSFSQSLKTNSEMLTSVHDIHETLKHILRTACLQIPGTSPLITAKDSQAITKCFELYPSTVPGARSLFLPISPLRTCAEASIPQEVCQCEYVQTYTTRRESTNHKLSKDIQLQAAKISVKHLNSLVPHHQLCQNFSIAKIIKVIKLHVAKIEDNPSSIIIVRLSVKVKSSQLENKQKEMTVEQRLRKVGVTNEFQPIGLPRWISDKKPNGYDCMSFARNPKIFYHQQAYCLCKHPSYSSL